MPNLIKLEFYKLKKQKIYKMLLLAVIIISALSAYSEMSALSANGILSSGKVSYINAFRDISMLFVSAMFAGFFIGSDFSNKTIQSQLSQGRSRWEVVVSKALVFFSGTSMIMLLYPITVSFIHTFKFGWGEPFTMISVVYILRVALLGAILNIGTTSIFVLFAFLCRDIPKTICLSVFSLVLFSVLSSILGNTFPVMRKIISFTTLAQLNHIADDIILPSMIISVLLSAGVTAVIAISLSNVLFAKAEIK